MQDPNRILISKDNKIKDFENYIDQNNIIKIQEDRLFKKACLDQIIPKNQLFKLLDDRIEQINKLKRRINFSKKLAPLKYKPNSKLVSKSKPLLKPINHAKERNGKEKFN